MRYRHYLTLRYEGPREAVGYSNVNTVDDSDTYSPVMPESMLDEAIEGVRNHWAERLECRPDQIVVVIINHMAVSL